MATKKTASLPKPAGKVATRRATAKANRAASTDSLARKRSLKVANEMAGGKRPLIPEESTELPLNATPLDVMVMAMRRAFMVGGSIAAAPFAEKAAPYLHAKISSIELKNPAAAATGGGTGKPIPFQIEFVDPKPEAPDA
jgi:hypothetical protein